MDIASLVIGIISAIVGLIPCVNFFVILPAILGLILGIIAFKQKKAEDLPSGIALAGIILNSLPLLIGVSMVIFALFSGDTYSVNDMTIK